ncbi:N-acetyltransferase GCN5 [Rhexocercosporidium sp. MPI-PUGE-AT-0058]|nr:N-acetyltransferase GCN5 [Rhexocercosporidium sp. MPI-PUGE-AT-0058]
MSLTIVDLDWNHPHGILLREAQRQELAQRYGTEDSEPGLAPTFANIATFIVAYMDNQPVGCVALRAHPSNSNYPGDAEVKRMYVLPGKRGRSFGVATALLEALEERARKRGWKKLVLETGILQPDAMRFYTREGYTLIHNFGAYVGEESSVCFERMI